MRKKYLLYIDILGFAEKVKSETEDVRRIYKIIEELNCHNHDSFKVLVFSDTILIYNIDDPFYEKDHRYIVMYLIEFAQDLLYNSIGKNFFYRSLLVYGDFEHSSPNNIERFFGEALVNAYLTEKDIPSSGLFIDSTCNGYNDIFHTEPLNKDLSFVYLNQSLDQLISGELGSIPIQEKWLVEYDMQWQLAKDVKYLKDIFQLMRSHEIPKVRQKFLMTWDFYEQRYGEITSLLEDEDFNPEAICPSYDWSIPNERILEGYRGKLISPTSKDETKKIIKKAREIGKKATEKKLEEIFGEKDPPADKYFFPCGGASIILDIDPRTKLGERLLKFSDDLKRAEIEKDHKQRGLRVSIYDMHSRQEMLIDEIANSAALQFLIDELNVDGYIESWVD